MRLVIKAKAGDKLFSKNMERWVGFAEHRGVMCTGGWDSRKKTADLDLYAHKPQCCKLLPGISRVTPAIRAELVAWLVSKGMSVKERR